MFIFGAQHVMQSVPGIFARVWFGRGTAGVVALATAQVLWKVRPSVRGYY